MKKQYMKPAMQVVVVQTTSQLLANSPEEESQNLRINRSRQIDDYDDLE